MIHTDTKQKLPRFLAYPVGAQAVSAALIDVPQLNDMSLSFSRHDYGSSERDERHICIAARYTKYNMGLSARRTLDEAGFYGPRWSATIYAVPTALNSHVRRALTSHGLEC